MIFFVGSLDLSVMGQNTGSCTLSAQTNLLDEVRLFSLLVSFAD